MQKYCDTWFRVTVTPKHFVYTSVGDHHKWSRTKSAWISIFFNDICKIGRMYQRQFRQKPSDEHCTKPLITDIVYCVILDIMLKNYKNA